jgi:hypothetical protein
MNEGSRRIWPLLDIAGMVLVVVGAAGFLTFIELEGSISIALFSIGVLFIFLASLMIHIEGSHLRADIEDHYEILRIRGLMDDVPDGDSDGYLIDLTDVDQKKKKKKDGEVDKNLLIWDERKVGGSGFL